MQISNTKPRFSTKRWIAAVLTAFLLLAGGLTTALGAGGAFLASRLAGSRLSADTAQLQDLRGWVEVQTAGGKWRTAQAGQIIRAGQRVRTGALSSADLAFFDGSRTILQANAELSVDQLHAPKNEARTIVLTQWSGESDHHVAPNKTEGSHYAVNTAAGTGEAKGTVFHVAVTGDEAARYEVSEGTVAVTGMEQTVMVNAGEVTTLSGNEPPLDPTLSISGQGMVTQIGDTWVIAGQEFAVSAETTISGSPVVGDWVLIEGRLLADGTKAADEIVLVYASPTNHFNIIGPVDILEDGSWTVNGQVVTLTAETLVDTDLVAGETVRVEGLILSDGTLQASSIRRIDAELGQPFDFVGVVQEMGAETWLVSGMPLAISGDTVVAEGLQTGEIVQVQGWIRIDGTWQAASILRMEEDAHPFDFTGKLESLDPWTVGGTTFQTGDWTQVDPELEVGDLVRVTGEIDGNGNWMAATIELVEEAEAPVMVVVGPVNSIDPWVVSGVQLSADETTVIDGEVTVGTLVQVTATLQPDGSWLMTEVKMLEMPSWLPESVEVTATVISINGDQLEIEGWPVLTLAEDVVIEGGELVAGATVRVQISFDESLELQVTHVEVVETDDDEDGEDDEDDQDDEDEDGEDGEEKEEKVDVCHKPEKKGGHTINIARPALEAHLAHGDYEGECK